MSVKSRLIPCLAILAIAVAIVEFTGVPISYSITELDDNTASWRFHREWPLGIRSKKVARSSALERVVQTHAPAELKHRWRTMYRTGRSLFGRSTSFSDGIDSPAFDVALGPLDSWVPGRDAKEVLELYRALASGNKVKADASVKKVLEDVK